MTDDASTIIIWVLLIAFLFFCTFFVSCSVPFA